MSLIRSVAELKNDNGRIRVADNGATLEIKIWNKAINESGFRIRNLEEFRMLLDDWQQLCGQLDLAITRYGGSAAGNGEFVGYDGYEER